MNFEHVLNETGIIAIVRGVPTNSIYNVVDALKKGGIKLIEVTVDTDNACKIIEELRYKYDNDLFVGAGTVLDKDKAKDVINSGAQFILSPNVNIEVIETTKQYGVISIPGALTPSEISMAFQYGADIVKLFPANLLGTGYMKAIREPLPNIPLLPTGGINKNNVKEFIQAGAIGVGVGGSLVIRKVAFDKIDLLEIEENAKVFVHLIKEARKDY